MSEVSYKWAREDFGDEYMRMYPESHDKVKQYRERNDGRFGMAVKDVTIVVTEDCNLRCSYCYQHDKNCEHRLTKETACRIVDTLFEEDARNNRYLNPAIAQALILDFIGGEPLLEIETISYFMRYFKWKALALNHRWAIHYMISISSNGTLYDNPEVQKFLTIHRGRVSLGITLDGSKELHDTCRRYPDGRPSYDIVAAAVKRCQRDFDQSRLTKLTLAPANIRHLYGAVKNLYESFNFEGVHANCVYEKGWTNEHAQIMYRQMRQLADWMIDEEVYKTFYCSLFSPIIGRPMDEDDNLNWCGGTGCMLAFTTQGHITPCVRYTRFNLNDAQPEVRIGDIETGIANTPEYRAVIDNLDSFTRRSQSTDECFTCPIASGCGWCSAYNYEIYGTPNKRATFICPTHKARVLANGYYWNKLYRKLSLADRLACHVPREWALEIVPEGEYEELLALAEEA
ncbi:MAG: radical SAM peptide maturase, CXXX-repeat target family [Clostridia bacterium]